ncbi:MAG: DUF2520 domain-containing protein [Salibacteraceae bacterium]
MNGAEKIAIVGLGNLGWNLTRGLHQSGFHITQIIARNQEDNQRFSAKVGATLAPDIDALDNSADIIFLCLPDDALPEVASKINREAVIVHCSGSTPLLTSHKKSGVLYPFQTFTKFIPVEWKGIPIFIESDDPGLRSSLISIAENLSGNAKEVNRNQRQAIHISGVYGANFVNHVLFMAKEVLDKERLTFDVLSPLIHETVRKAFKHGPHSSQTGPARRNDEKVIAKHLAVLEDDKKLQTFYELFSNSIKNTYRS